MTYVIIKKTQVLPPKTVYAIRVKEFTIKTSYESLQQVYVMNPYFQ